MSSVHDWQTSEFGWPRTLGEFKFYWASSTSDALARMGEWYNQLVIHTDEAMCKLDQLNM